MTTPRLRHVGALLLPLLVLAGPSRDRGLR